MRLGVTSLVHHGLDPTLRQFCLKALRHLAGQNSSWSTLVVGLNRIRDVGTSGRSSKGMLVLNPCPVIHEPKGRNSNICTP